MASSFISFRENGFWINDNIMNITLHFLGETVNKIEEKPEWLKEFNEKIIYNSQGYQRSFMDFGMDDYLIDKDRIKLFTEEILIECMKNLLDKGNEISADELNSFIVNENIQSEWDKPIKVSRIINVLKWLKGLSIGVVRVKDSDYIYYKF